MNRNKNKNAKKTVEKNELKKAVENKIRDQGFGGLIKSGRLQVLVSSDDDTVSEDNKEREDDETQEA